MRILLVWVVSAIWINGSLAEAKQGKPSLVQLVASAKNFIDNEDYSSSEELLLKAINQMEPNDLSSRRFELDSLLLKAYVADKKLDAAESFAIENLKLARTRPKNVKYLVHALCLLAGIQINNDKYQDAEKNATEALQIADNFKTDKTHPLLTLGSLRFAQKRFDESEKLYKQVLDKESRSSLISANAVECLALLYKSQGEMHKAQALYQSEIPIFERKNEKESQHALACIYVELAYVLSAEEKYSDSERYFKLALQLLEKLGTHGETEKRCRSGYSAVLQLQNKLDEARKVEEVSPRNTNTGDRQ